MIFVASASEIQSTFFARICLTMSAHFSFVSLRAVARSIPWQTLHFISKTVFPSGMGAAMRGGGAAGLGGSCLAQPMANARNITDTTIRSTERTGISDFLLGGNGFRVSYPAPAGDSTVPWRHH